MLLEIKRASNIIAAVNAQTAKLSRKIMADNIITASFKYSQTVNLQIGDYIVFQGQNYTLNQQPKITKLAGNSYTYDLTFEGVEYELSKVQYQFTGDGQFPLMNNADGFLTLLVSNLNRVYSGYTKNANVTPLVNDYKNLSFNSESCLQVLNRLCSEFDMEYYFIGKQINLVQTYGTNNGITLQYGYNSGLYQITRNTVNSKNIITRVYAFGSTRNTDQTTYRAVSGIGKKRLQLPVANTNSKIDSNIASYGIIEATKIFDDIYPRRTGTISAIGADIYTFSDTSMDFDLNSYLLSGVTAKINFQSGNLGGYEFEVISYTHATKTFVIKAVNDGNAGIMPNATLKPAIGDKYKLLDIKMPAPYITAAENELYNKAIDFLTTKCNDRPKVNYSVVIDHLFFKRNNYSINLGDSVTVIDADLAVNNLIRIQSYTQNLLNIYDYTIELADVTERPSVVTLLTNMAQTNTAVQVQQSLQQKQTTFAENAESDNKLTPIDKLQLRSMWEIIVNEKTAIYNQGTTYACTTERDTYNTAFANLANYLNGGTTYTFSLTIPPVFITDTNMAITTIYNGAAFRALAQTYYTARTALINAINTKVTKVNLDVGVQTAGSLEVGSGSTVKAGLDGSGTDTYDVRFWAGETKANRGIAPVRILQNGDIVLQGLLNGSTQFLTITDCRISSGQSPRGIGKGASSADWALYSGFNSFGLYFFVGEAIDPAPFNYTWKGIYIDGVTALLKYENENANILGSDLAYSFFKSTTAPTSPTNGTVYYNTADNKLKVYANGTWVNLH